MRHAPLRRAPLLIALALCLNARADVVYLTDGTVVEGEVTYVGNMVKVRQTSGITVTHPKYMVRKVVKSVSAAEEYRKRSEPVEPDDAKGLLELARWCRERKLDTEAEAAYRAALEIASPVYREAKREFAKFLEGNRRLKEAHRLYTDLGAPAANDAAFVSAQLDRLRAEAYEKGTRCLLSADRRGALLELQRALSYAPSAAPATTGIVAEADVLAKIVEVRKELVEAKRRPAIDMKPCPVCKGTSVVACKACGGKGQIRKLAQVLTARGPDVQWRWFPCETCRGGGKVRCDSCGGASIDISGLGPARSAVRALASAAASSAKGSLSGAVRRMNRAITKHRLAFGPNRAPYPVSEKLRQLIPAAPASANELGKLGAPWRAADGSERLNFLANYALESAQLLSHFSESAYKEPADAGPGPDELRSGAEPADATRLSAFPDEAAGRVCSVPCVWRGTGDPEGDEYRLGLAVEAAGPHTLAPFTWKQSARPVMERLGGVLGLPGISARAVAYPFAGLEGAIRARRPGDRVSLVGRMLYDREPSPEWRFEVWKIVPRLDEETERLVALLSRKVSFRFDDTPLDASMEMLSDLTGVRIRVDVPTDAGFRVTARARKTPLGRALDAMLQKIDLSWKLGTIDVRSVRVVDRATPEERARVEEFLKLIR